MSFSNFFNPEVTNLDFSITVSMRTANESWEFSDWIELERQEGESYDEAFDRIVDAISICVTIKGEKESPDVMYNSVSNGQHTVSFPTGDDKKTIEDVIKWLSGTAEKIIDRSWNNKNNTYQPAFAQFKTQD